MKPPINSNIELLTGNVRL